jgi:hypothetical protein
MPLNSFLLLSVSRFGTLANTLSTPAKPLKPREQKPREHLLERSKGSLSERASGVTPLTIKQTARERAKPANDRAQVENVHPL